MRILPFLIAWMVLWAASAWAQTAPAISPSPSQMTACAQSARYDNTTSGATLLVTGVGAERIYVCGLVNNWMQGVAGTRQITTQDIVTVTNAARDAYRQTFGAK